MTALIVVLSSKCDREISLHSHRCECKCYVLTWGSQHGMNAFDVWIVVWFWWWCNAWELDCCTSTLSLVIHQVRFQKNLWKNRLVFKGVGETPKTINFDGSWVFTLSFFFSERLHCCYIYFHCSYLYSYLRSVNRVITSWRIFGYFYRVFWRLHFSIVKYLSFHNSSSFALRYFFNVNGKAAVWRTPCYGLFSGFPQSNTSDGWVSLKCGELWCWIQWGALACCSVVRAGNF